MTRLVHVEWEDACGDDPWRRIDELTQEPPVCQTIGFLVRQTAKAITVASTISDDGDCCCSMVIPRGMIIAIRDVVLGEPLQLSPEP